MQQSFQTKELTVRHFDVQELLSVLQQVYSVGMMVRPDRAYSTIHHV